MSIRWCSPRRALRSRWWGRGRRGPRRTTARRGGWRRGGTAPDGAALRVLAQGLIDFGLCQGSVDKVIEAGDYKRYYMHRTGHWLGLDVHDAGDYKRDGQG